ncbi:hypothetical protein PG997_013605 [Apiospora hydei]|uniref:Zn(2)-C6 fungal-type domain-containing protein n=1 Tax=Apiospora hydei TaxID=1337664 RepID=A0ABR1VA72_9PEZI
MTTSCAVCQLPIAEALQPPNSSRQCPFCSAIFSRVDGARRHAKCCPQRGSRALRTRQRGRRAKSCDQCSRVKVHCNAGHPCERCISRELDCAYSRYCTNTTHRQPTAHQEPPVSPSHSSSHNRVPLSFLLNYTDERQDFVTEKAVGEEPDGDLIGPACVAPQPQALSDTTVDYIDPMLLLPFENDQTDVNSLELGGLYDTEDQTLLGALLFQAPQSQEDQLAARLGLLELQVTAHISSNYCSRGGSCDPSAIRGFFSVFNVQSFAMTFCRKRHYRYPIIHWPTFALEEASLPLLLVVALTGATYSYRPGHGPERITEARELYLLADSYVFHQLRTFLDHLPPTLTEVDLAEGIQLCQAALLMYGLDTLLAGDSALQRVAMAERLPALISALRRLELVGYRHNDEPSSEGAGNWKLFIRREQVIRLVSWTYCVDCLATLSCNNPPILSLMEISGDLPCDPALWDADSDSTFEAARRFSSQRYGVSQPLNILLPRLLDSDAPGDGEWDHLPLFHLHIIMCDTKRVNFTALQPIIFNLHISMALPQQAERLLQMLNTWRYLWERAWDKVPHDHLRYLGIARNIPDIECLSRRIIEVAASSEGSTSRYLQRVPSYSSKDIHEFIRDFTSSL